MDRADDRAGEHRAQQQSEQRRSTCAWHAPTTTPSSSVPSRTAMKAVVMTMPAVGTVMSRGPIHTPSANVDPSPKASPAALASIQLR